MKSFIIVLLMSLVGYTGVYAQGDISGAWKLTDGETQHQFLFQSGFFFHTIYQRDKFVMTRGGECSAQRDTLKTTILFNSTDSTEVGKRLPVPFSINSGILSLNLAGENVKLERIDDGKAELKGVWIISARMDDKGNITPIHQTGTRQTYKMLTGTKFQWVAIDPSKKQFSGTGGGSYTFKEGKYTENIEFFSRDNSRVGASLVFDGKLVDHKWHHSGLSSKGAKIYEVWDSLVIVTSYRTQKKSPIVHK
jgi:hypothetical protein